MWRVEWQPNEASQAQHVGDAADPEAGKMLCWDFEAQQSVEFEFAWNSPDGGRTWLSRSRSGIYSVAPGAGAGG